MTYKEAIKSFEISKINNKKSYIIIIYSILCFINDSYRLEMKGVNDNLKKNLLSVWLWIIVLSEQKYHSTGSHFSLQHTVVCTCSLIPALSALFLWCDLIWIQRWAESPGVLKVGGKQQHNWGKSGGN